MYLALYRKYRSSTFDEVISQDHITTTLKNQITTGKLAHAYLFTGSRGTGKTTCAKLMAKAVNCLSPKDGSPCGECESCKAIAAGCPDIIEMDAASNNGVDDVRALRDEVMYTPVQCRYKVYIIDEVHMMSASAFNALLKTIEEPPAHVIFILATTEIHKVPATIVSRCQQFRFRRIDAYDSSGRLCEIAVNEGAELSEDAAQLISRLSDGGMRDAISLLDQCISVNKNVTEQVVRDTAGIAGTEYLFRLADCIYNKTTAEALIVLDELHSMSKDPVLLMDELTGHFRNLCLLASTNMSFALIPAGSGSRNDLARQAQQFTLGEIMRAIEILQDYSSRASRTANRKTLAEMCFIRLCTPRLDSDTSALSLRLEKLENKVDSIRQGTVVTDETTPKPLPPAFMMARTATPEPKAEEKPAEDIPKTTVCEQQEPSYEQTAQEAPQTDSATVRNDEQGDAPPSWLFEGDSGDFSGAVYEDNTPAVAEAISVDDDGYDAEVPPFDLDEDVPPVTVAETEQETAPAITETATESPLYPEYGEPPVAVPSQPADDDLSDRLQAAGQWAEIIDTMPMFLQPILRQVKAQIAEDSIIIKEYQPFHQDFLKVGDSMDRIKKAAKDVTGRNLMVVFDEQGTAVKQDENDPLGAFIDKAKSRGVNIKYKK